MVEKIIIKWIVHLALVQPSPGERFGGLELVELCSISKGDLYFEAKCFVCI
jgi:hypothetical protein